MFLWGVDLLGRSTFVLPHPVATRSLVFSPTILARLLAFKATVELGQEGMGLAQVETS